MKRILKLLLCFVMLSLTPVINAYAVENEVSVLLDGYSVPFDVPGRIIDNRTMVPLRGIFEALDAEVEWDQDTRKVTSTKNGDVIELTIGSNDLYKNGDKIASLDVPAKIVTEDGIARTLVPLRAVSEAFGCKVEWDGVTRTAIILDIDENTVMRIGHSPVSSDMYKYFYKNAEKILSLDLYDNPEELIKSTALEELILFYSTVNLANSSGFSAHSKDTIESVNSIIEAYKSGYEENFETVMSESNLTEKVLYDVLTVEKFQSDLTKSIMETAQSTPAQDVVNEVMADDGFIRAAAIVVLDKDTAEEIYNIAVDATDEEFLSLAREYTVDSTFAENKDGYYFTYGQMIPQFEESAFSLIIGQTSKIIKTPSSYTIIRRMPKDEAHIYENAATVCFNKIMANYTNSITEIESKLLNSVSYFESFNDLLF